MSAYILYFYAYFFYPTIGYRKSEEIFVLIICSLRVKGRIKTYLTLTISFTKCKCNAKYCNNGIIRQILVKSTRKSVRKMTFLSFLLYPLNIQRLPYIRCIRPVPSQHCVINLGEVPVIPWTKHIQ